MKRGTPLPTAAGAALILVALALPIGGRLLGIRELYELGVAAGTLAVTALVHVARSHRPLVVQRRLVPGDRIHAGGSVTVQVEVANPGAPATSLIRYEERTAELLGEVVAEEIGRLRAGERVTFSHRIAAPRRGVYSLGPSALITSDPFGLAHLKQPIADRVSIYVYPRTEVLSLGPASGVAAGSLDAPGSNPSSASGEFFAIREYTSGDEARKIHWRTTARSGRLMVRQDEHDREPRACVVLDNTGPPAAREAFEAAVGSAASLVSLFHTSGFDVSLAVPSEPLPGGVAPGGSRTEAAFHGAMERLALVEIAPQGDIAATVGRAIADVGREGVVVVTSTGISDGLAAAVTAGPSEVILVLHTSSPNQDPDWVEALRARGVRMMMVGPGLRFSTMWNEGAAAHYSSGIGPGSSR